MREIKCRAWSQKENKWFDGYSNILHLFAQDTGGHGKTETEDYIYSFSTGLKDKNGKEIYEGDIIKTKHVGQRREITFREGMFFPLAVIGDMELNEVEVIGNIYESPELLK